MKRRISEASNQWFSRKEKKAETIAEFLEAMDRVRNRLPGQCEQCQHDNYSDHREDGWPVQKLCLICGGYCREN